MPAATASRIRESGCDLVARVAAGLRRRGGRGRRGSRPGGRRSGCGRRSGGCRQRRRARPPCAAARDRLLDVLAADPPAHAGARDLRQVQVVLRREPPHQRRERRPAAVGRRSGRRRGRGSGGRRRGCRRGRGRGRCRRHPPGPHPARRCGRPACRPAPSPPPGTRISRITPSYGLGISESTLSVDTSNSGSSNATASPTFLSQLPTVPSVTVSPELGHGDVVHLAGRRGAGEPANRRRHPGRRWRARPRSRPSPARRGRTPQGRTRPAPGVDPGSPMRHERRADGHRLPRRHEDLEDHPVVRAGDLRVDLVRGHLEQRVVERDRRRRRA